MSRKTMMTALDRRVREVLWSKERGRCYACGDPASDVAHLFGRKNLTTRWDVGAEGNCHLMCRACHRRDHDGNLRPSYRELYARRNGQAALDALALRANRPLVDSVLVYLEQRLEALRGRALDV